MTSSNKSIKKEEEVNRKQNYMLFNPAVPIKKGKRNRQMLVFLVKHELKLPQFLLVVNDSSLSLHV